MDTERKASEDREAIAIKVARILRDRNKKKVQKLRVFLDDIL